MLFFLASYLFLSIEFYALIILVPVSAIQILAELECIGRNTSIKNLADFGRIRMYWQKYINKESCRN